MSERARFKSGDFGLQDEERPGQPKKFEDEELEALLDEDCCQTQEELAESLGVTQSVEFANSGNTTHHTQKCYFMCLSRGNSFFRYS